MILDLELSWSHFGVCYGLVGPEGLDVSVGAMGSQVLCAARQYVGSVVRDECAVVETSGKGHKRVQGRAKIVVK